MRATLTAFSTYLGRLLWGVWGWVGELATISLFLPGLESYRPFVATVVVAAFVLAAFRLSQQQRRTLSDRDSTIRGLYAELEEARAPRFQPERRALAQRELAKLDKAERATMRILIQRGNMRDREACEELKAMGFGERGSAFSSIHSRTCLVRRDAYDPRVEKMFGNYPGPWYPNGDLKAVLEQLAIDGET